MRQPQQHKGENRTDLYAKLLKENPEELHRYFLGWLDLKHSKRQMPLPHVPFNAFCNLFEIKIQNGEAKLTPSEARSLSETVKKGKQDFVDFWKNTNQQELNTLGPVII